MDLRKLITDRNATCLIKSLRCTLRFPAIIYGSVVATRNCLYDRGLKQSHSSSAIVISIGNLSVGGTGKSPAVAWLCGWLRQHSVRVAVLSRGYRELECGRNDEALELELRHTDVPHLQAADRVRSAELATSELDMQVLLLDDGFQHRRLRRDIDIVLIDASEPSFAMKLLPAGVLRESMRSLRRADVILLTRCQQASAKELDWYQKKIAQFAPSATVCLTNHSPSKLYSDLGEEPLEVISGKQILAFCAIGKPTAFFRTLTDLGAKVLDTRIYPDHHQFTSQDVQRLESWARQTPSAELIICTMKDWVKLQVPELSGMPLKALIIDMSFSSGLSGLEKRLRSALGELTD